MASPGLCTSSSFRSQKKHFLFPMFHLSMPDPCCITSPSTTPGNAPASSCYLEHPIQSILSALLSVVVEFNCQLDTIYSHLENSLNEGLSGSRWPVGGMSVGDCLN